MPKVDVDRIVGTIRESAADVRVKTEDAVEDVADKIEDALEKAGTEGRKLQRQVKEELSRRWRQVDRVGRENAFLMAAGALAVGALIGWLVARDRKR